MTIKWTSDLFFSNQQGNQVRVWRPPARDMIKCVAISRYLRLAPVGPEVQFNLQTPPRARPRGLLLLSVAHVQRIIHRVHLSAMRMIASEPHFAETSDPCLFTCVHFVSSILRKYSRLSLHYRQPFKHHRDSYPRQVLVETALGQKIGCVMQL